MCVLLAVGRSHRFTSLGVRELSKTRRGMSQRLFSRCMIYRVVGLPRLCLRWLEGSVNHALQRATLRSAAAPFQCNDGEPRGTVLRGVVQKIHGHKLSLPARWYACYVFFNSSRCYQLREHFFCSSQKMSHRIDLASAHI